jgi:hypothetical protein
MVIIAAVNVVSAAVAVTTVSDRSIGTDLATILRGLGRTRRVFILQHEQFTHNFHRRTKLLDALFESIGLESTQTKRNEPKHGDVADS